MEKYNDVLTRVKNAMKELVTADNADKMGNIDKDIDILTGIYAETEKNNNELKDTMVQYVKHTGFKTPSSETDPAGLGKLTLDEAISASLNEILNKE